MERSNLRKLTLLHRLIFAAAMVVGFSADGAGLHLPGVVNIGSQMSIGTTADPSSKAVIDAVSTTKGMLDPRMTTTQRDAITSVPEALRLYNTTTHHPNFYNGSSWLEVADISSSQTLTNKTISGSSNTLSNVSLTSAVTGVLPEANGGTNQSTYALGDILYSSATNTLSKLSGNTSATKKYLSQTGNGTVSAAPAWAQPACGDLSNASASCSTDATNASNISSGTLAVARGGTGLGSGTSGGILGYTASGTIASSSALTANQVVIGGGAGATPTTLAAGSQYQVLRMGAANPAYGSINLDQTAAVTGTLPVGNGGLGIASGTSGGVPYFSGSTTIASSAALTASQLIKGGGAGAAPATFAACSDGQIIKYASGVPACGADSTGAGSLSYRSVTTTDAATTSDDVLLLSGSSFTETLFTAVGNTGKVIALVHNGTSLTNIYTLATTSSQTIGGIASLSYILYTKGEILRLISDGSNWLILDHTAKTGWSSTSTISVASTATSMGKGTNTVDRIAWRRDGNTMHIFAAYKQTAAGTVGSGVYLITIPGSQSADTTNMIASTDTTAGGNTAVRANSALKGDGWAYSSNGTSRGAIVPVLWDSTRFTLAFVYASGELWNAAGVLKFNETDWGFGLHAEIPISGWQP
jgi:hypothetical protein